jgi:hypothetical protein
VIDGDAALRQQFLKIAVGQPAPEVPADGDPITSRGNRKPANTEDLPDDVTEPVSRRLRSANATLPAEVLRGLLKS